METAVAETAGSVSRQLPCYQSHKKVWALKIAAIEREFTDAKISGGIITPAEEGYAPFRVTVDYLRKHNPEAGGYWVQYADGYQSFSPAKAFEEGYTRVSTRVQE